MPPLAGLGLLPFMGDGLLRPTDCCTGLRWLLPLTSGCQPPCAAVPAAAAPAPTAPDGGPCCDPPGPALLASEELLPRRLAGCWASGNATPATASEAALLLRLRMAATGQPPVVCSQAAAAAASLSSELSWPCGFQSWLLLAVEPARCSSGEPPPSDKLLLLRRCGWGSSPCPGC